MKAEDIRNKWQARREFFDNFRKALQEIETSMIQRRNAAAAYLHAVNLLVKEEFPVSGEERIITEAELARCRMYLELMTKGLTPSVEINP